MDKGFDEVVLPHLRAAQRLARWLTKNEHDAEDVVQEAALRALRYFRTFTGGNGRAWFLKIVRNTCHTWWRRNFLTPTDPFDEKQHNNGQPASDPETLLLHTEDLALIERAMNDLPGRYRELFGLRELAGLSYQELAAAVGIPVGTVMSRLSRARRAFHRALDRELNHSSVANRTQSRERGEGSVVKKRPPPEEVEAFMLLPRRYVRRTSPVRELSVVRSLVRTPH